MRLARIAVIMVLLITVFLPLAIQPDSIAYADGTGVEYWAVIIGVSSYLYIDDVNYSDDSATALYQKLAPIWSADHINLLTNSNAGKTAVQNTIQTWLASREDSDDVVLLYFTGHGDEYLGDYYICPYYELSNWLSILDSNNVVVAIDTCNSGGFITDLPATAQVIMASSAASESSYGDSYLQANAFSYYLLQAINNITASNTNTDYILTTQEVFNYASPRVTQYMMEDGYTQHPVNYDSYSGGLPLFMIIAVDANTVSASFTIDGTNYSSLNIPDNFLITPNSSHFVTVPLLINQSTDTRRMFQSWSDGNTSSTRVISQGGQYIANYVLQYYLSVSSEQGSVSGTGWYDFGTYADTGSANLSIDQGNTRHLFQHWEVDGVEKVGNPLSVLMNAPHTAVADYKTQHYLSVQSDYGHSSGTGWYDTGTYATASVTPVVGTLIRHKFAGWSEDIGDDQTSTSILMNQPKSIVATWKMDYFYLYLLIGGVLGVCILIAVLLSIRIRGRRLHRRITRKQKRYA
jgi:hypothetical protein